MTPSPRAILLVDDNPHARAVIARILEALQCTVVTFSNGAEAIDAAKVQSFDAAFIDIEMPGLDGFETATALGGLVPRLVAVTGRDPASVNRGGFAAILTKPLDVDKLARSLEALFRG